MNSFKSIRNNLEVTGQITSVLLVLRLVIVILSSYLVASSYYFGDIYNHGVSQSTFVIVLIVGTKSLIAIILEVFSTTEIGESEIVSLKSQKRLLIANIFLLFSEVTIFTLVINRLDQGGIDNLVMQVGEGVSILTILVGNPNGFAEWLVISFYIIAMVVLLFPQDDKGQKDQVGGSLVLFLRTLFLPV